MNGAVDSILLTACLDRILAQVEVKMFFGTGAKVPEELSLAKGNARAARMATNRAMSCERCLCQQASLPGEQFPH